MNAFFGWLKKITPLRITMVIAILFSTTHFIIEDEIFEHGLFSKNGYLHQLDVNALNLKFQSRPPIDAEPKVVIAAIDEKSIERFGLWPWSRAVIADFINVATTGGAKVVGFDAVFSDEDRTLSYMNDFLRLFDETGLHPESATAKALAKTLGEMQEAQQQTKVAMITMGQRAKSSRGGEKRQIENALNKLRKAEERNSALIEKITKQLNDIQTRSRNYYTKIEGAVASGSPDEALAAAVANSPQTVLGYFNFYDRADIVGVSEAEALTAMQRLAPVAIENVYELVVQNLGEQQIEMLRPNNEVDVEKLQITEIVGARPPLIKFSEAARSFGYFNVIPDSDGSMRRIRLLNKYKDKLYPSLSLEVARRYFDGENRPLTGTIKPQISIDGINIAADRNVPTDLHGRMLVNYYQDPAQFFPTYSVADFVDGHLPEEAYKDKVVLFGMTAQGLFDLRPTPFSATTPGVYVHASAIQNIIDENYLERFYGLALIEILGYLLLGLIIGLILPKLPAWAGVLATLGLAVALYMIDVIFVFPSGLWTLTMLPGIQAFVSFVAVSIYGFLTEGREKRKIRKAFQFYLTKSVVDEMLKDPEKLKLGGERRTCTVLFSDIRGFTSISEHLSPEALSHLLNEYLTPMTNLVFKYDGTLDKYMGDAIMAIFGAPVAHPQHASLACFTALEMMEELHVLQEGWRKEGLPELDIGIGMNTGPMSVGNMGSDVRFDYTVMGDNVNLGSRLEGINKQYGTNIIISEMTYAAAKNDVHVRELDSVRVKGKREPVTIFELLGRGEPTGDKQQLIEAFTGGLALYKKQQWDDALAIFDNIQKTVKPGDKASLMYIERCEAMRQNPPGDNWDGVFTMTTK